MILSTHKSRKGALRESHAQMKTCKKCGSLLPQPAGKYCAICGVSLIGETEDSRTIEPAIEVESGQVEESPAGDTTGARTVFPKWVRPPAVSESVTATPESPLSEPTLLEPAIPEVAAPESPRPETPADEHERDESSNDSSPLEIESGESKDAEPAARFAPGAFDWGPTRSPQAGAVASKVLGLIGRKTRKSS